MDDKKTINCMYLVLYWLHNLKHCFIIHVDDVVDPPTTPTLIGSSTYSLSLQWKVSSHFCLYYTECVSIFIQHSLWIVGHCYSKKAVNVCVKYIVN